MKPPWLAGKSRKPNHRTHETSEQKKSHEKTTVKPTIKSPLNSPLNPIEHHSITIKKKLITPQ